MSVIEALKSAKLEIQQYGWHYGRERDWQHRNGTTCAGVAIEDACVRFNLRDGEAFEPFRKAIECRDVLTWNDAPGRTVEEVLAAFDRAIAIAEKGG